MGKLSLEDVCRYVSENIGSFHAKRLESLSKLSLEKILKRKNPYLFKAKNIHTSHDLVRILMDAHLSSQEEAVFGTFLEGLAIFICGIVYQGKKSSAEGIDLEFDKKDITYIVTIKSGPNWANSGQIANMKSNFKKAKKILGTNRGRHQIIAVNGCCYGKDDQPDKGEYLKLCGQRFWAFISNNQKLYTEIIEPLGYRAKEKNEEFFASYGRIINKFTYQFTEQFCTPDGEIKWAELVKFNSGSDR